MDPYFTFPLADVLVAAGHPATLPLSRIRRRAWPSLAVSIRNSLLFRKCAPMQQIGQGA